MLSYYYYYIVLYYNIILYFKECSVVKKLDPVTEETETESPPGLPPPGVPAFQPILQLFNPKSEAALNKTFILGQTLGDGNFAVVKTAISR